MKRELLSLLVLILLAGTSCQEKIDIQLEKEAIKAVILEESDAYSDKDLDRMNATWFHDASSRKVDICKYCGTIEYVGWVEISNKNKTYFTPAKIEATKELIVSYSNFDINVIENTALVYHDAKWSGKLRGEDFNFEDKRIVHLRKIENEWKIDLFIHYSLPDKESETEES